MLNRLDPQLLHALCAVIDTGSFDAASASLGVTPSAITQRIQRLEEQVGMPLILRARPCVATSSGLRLRRHADEIALLEHGVRADLGIEADHSWPRIRIALNADSLATWFVDAMAHMGEFLFDLVIDDQDHSLNLLRRGEVMAAVTANAEPIRGCDARPLGTLAYRATASPDFLARWFPNGLTASALNCAPVLLFDAKDRLQARWAAAEGLGDISAAPTHRIPSTTAFVEAAERGLGWGINPTALVQDALAANRLLTMGKALHTPLYWHWNTQIGTQLEPITRAVRHVARAQLTDI